MCEIDKVVSQMSGRDIYSYATGSIQVETYFKKYNLLLTELKNLISTIEEKQTKYNNLKVFLFEKCHGSFSITNFECKNAKIEFEKLPSQIKNFVLLKDELQTRVDSAKAEYESKKQEYEAEQIALREKAKQEQANYRAEIARIESQINNIADVEERNYQRKLLEIKKNKAKIQEDLLQKMISEEQANYEKNLSPSQKKAREEALAKEQQIAEGLRAIAELEKSKAAEAEAAEQAAIDKQAKAKKKKIIIIGIISAVVILGGIIAYKKGWFSKIKK